MKKPVGGNAVYTIIAGIIVLVVIFCLLSDNRQTPSEPLATESYTKAPTETPKATQPYTDAPTQRPTQTPTQQPTNTPTPSTTETPTLRQGDKGETVKKIQTELIRLGYLSGKADGDFGRMTTQAVKDFQVCNGIKEDGIFGAQCWDKMFGWVSANPQKTVYVSKNNIYHTNEHCSGMKSSTKMKLSDAIRKGLTGHNCH